MLASVTDFRRSGLLTITGNPKDRVACSELYGKYSDWCDEIGGQKLSKRAFWQGLEELGVGRSRSNKTRFYTGVEMPSWKKKIKLHPLDKNEDGIYIAPADLPEEYADFFNETSRERQLSYALAQGLLAALRTQHAADRAHAEMSAADTLTVTDRDLRAHPMLDAYSKQMSEAASWYQILGLVGAESD